VASILLSFRLHEHTETTNTPVGLQHDPDDWKTGDEADEGHRQGQSGQGDKGDR
jgi:hypothetical protein